MRVIDTFAKGRYKVTIFQTESRYLLQAEDEQFILSWKLDKELPYARILDEGVSLLLEQAGETWPQLRENLSLSLDNGQESEDFPKII